jgi:predicted Rossmann-fold nucleotide-binding protein
MSENINAYPLHEKNLTERILETKAAFKGAKPKELRALRESYVRLVKQHPDYLKREMKASILGGANVENFTPEELNAVTTTSEALAETNISLFTGGYTGVMDVSSKAHQETKSSEIGVPGKTWAITLKDVMQGQVTQWAVNSPSGNLPARLEKLTKEVDIVIAMKGAEGSMREIMEAMYDDWPKETKKRFVIAFGEDHALNIIHALRYRKEGSKKEKLNNTFYFDFDSFTKDDSAKTKEYLKKIFTYIYEQTYSEEKECPNNPELDKLRFANQINKEKLIEIAKKEIIDF